MSPTPKNTAAQEPAEPHVVILCWVLTRYEAAMFAVLLKIVDNAPLRLLHPQEVAVIYFEYHGKCTIL